MRSALQDGLMKRERQEMSAGCAYGIGLVILKEIKNREIIVPVFPVFCHKWSQYLAGSRRSKAAQNVQQRH